MGIHLQSSNGIALNSLRNRIRFDLRESIIVPNNVDAYVSLVSFRYSNIFYNIDSHNCNLYYSLSSDIGTIDTLVVPVGNYTISSLLSYLNTELLDTGLIFTYNAQLFRVSVNNDSWGFIIRSGINSIASALGIVTPTAQDVTHTGLNSIDLGGINTIQIALPNLNLNSNGVRGSLPSVIEVLNNDVLVGSTKSHSNQNAVKYRVNQTVISSIETTLLGDGRDIDFQGLSFYISLNFVFVYKFDFIAPFDRFGLSEQEQVAQTKQLEDVNK